MDKTGLIQWLVKECIHQSIPVSQLIVFISSLIDDLIETRSLKIDHLVFKRFKLKEAIKRKMLFHIMEAKKKSFMEFLFPAENVIKDEPWQFKVGEDFVFPSLYPASNYYSGSFIFKKHFFPNIAEMNEEETECALNIDMDPNVEFWIRNLQRLELYSFSLQTSTDKFYPDFIVRLIDGTIVIVEYKGTDRYNTDDSKEKRQIGDFYAGCSDGRCRFIMLNGKDWGTLKGKLSIHKESKQPDHDKRN